jgi:hypothetical protein
MEIDSNNRQPKQPVAMPPKFTAPPLQITLTPFWLSASNQNHSHSLAPAPAQAQAPAPAPAPAQPKEQPSAPAISERAPSSSGRKRKAPKKEPSKSSKRSRKEPGYYSLVQKQYDYEGALLEEPSLFGAASREPRSHSSVRIFTTGAGPATLFKNEMIVRVLERKETTEKRIQNIFKRPNSP